SGDLRGERRGVEARDASNARPSGEDICPGFAHPDTDRTDDTQPGYNHSALGQLGPGARLLLEMRVDVVDGLLDGSDLLGLLVRDLALEFLLEGHHQLDGVQ